MLTPQLPPRTRSGQDLDFASVKASRKGVSALLEAEGYLADRNYNALYGDKQLYFAHAQTGQVIDVIVDRLQMCHVVPFAERATLLPFTLAPTDLLLSKLQIVEFNEKDLDDSLRLLATHPVVERDDPEGIDLRVICALTADDWGWWRTLTANLEHLAAGAAIERPALAGATEDAGAAVARISAAVEAVPKSRRWKLRARVGERKRWYEVPEETEHHE